MKPRTIPAALWTAIILVVCLTPASWLGGGGTGEGLSWLERTFGPLLGALPFDKAVHFGIFLVFGLVWRWARVSGWAILIGGAALALSTEVGQAIPILERTADLGDLIADLLGILAALVVTRPWSGRNPDAESAPAPNS